VTGSCRHGNEPPSSVKGGDFLDWLSDCQLLNKEWSKYHEELHTLYSK
jgi:hypothetical protein